MEIAATARDPKESTMNKDYKTFKVGYSDYDTLAEAQTEATKRSFKDWSDTPVYQLVGQAKFDVTKLGSDLVTYETVTQ